MEAVRQFLCTGRLYYKNEGLSEYRKARSKREVETLFVRRVKRENFFPKIQT
jgi:hypothetical protein